MREALLPRDDRLQLPHDRGPRGASAWANCTRLERTTSARIANAAYLSAHLPADKVRAPAVRPGTRHVFHQYTVRDIAAAGPRRRARPPGRAGRGQRESITPCRSTARSLYRALGYGDEHFPVTEELTRRVLSLPVHPAADPGRPGDHRRRRGGAVSGDGSNPAVARRRHRRGGDGAQPCPRVQRDGHGPAGRGGRRRPGHRRARRAACSMTPYFTDVARLLDETQPQVVAVAVPTLLHLPVARDVLRRGHTSAGREAARLHRRGRGRDHRPGRRGGGGADRRPCRAL